MKTYTIFIAAIFFHMTKLIFCQLEVSQIKTIPEEDKLYRLFICMVEDLKTSGMNLEIINKQNYLNEIKDDNIRQLEGRDINTLPPLFEGKTFYDVEIIPILTVIKGLTGEIKFKMIISSEGGSYEDQVNLKYTKVSGIWKLFNNASSNRFLSCFEKNYSPRLTESITAFTIRESNKTLIPHRITTEPEIWDLNKNITWNYFEKWLFANNSEVDVDFH